jgi:hypothetical protein
MSDKKTFNCFVDSKYLSYKHSNYFSVYDSLLENYKNKKIVFVEVGVMNGGSLFMWKNYCGDQARIIGVDLNPSAKKWEEYGFEIHIGSQSDEAFWNDFYSKVGDIDILLDDGGHTNQQQITTVEKSIAHIKDGGLIIVEDVHTSYMESFGNPSKFSFISYIKEYIDRINNRSSEILSINKKYSRSVFSISIFDSIVCLQIDRSKSQPSTPVSNNGLSSNAIDYRNKDNILIKGSYVDLLVFIFQIFKNRYTRKAFYKIREWILSRSISKNFW